MINLTESQKEILIFLLIALALILLVSFASYCIWQRLCLPKLAEQQEQRRAQDPFMNASANGDGSESGRLHADRGEQREGSQIPLNPLLNDYHAIPSTSSPSLATPTAPSLASFYTGVSNGSTETSNISGSRERLPTYQEAINHHMHS